MKNNNRPSIDGFIPRRPGSELGEQRTNKHADEAIRPIDRSIHTGDSETTDRIGETRRARSVGRNDIDESLNEIDALTPEPSKKPRKQSRKDRKAKKPKSKARRIIKWVFIGLLIIALLFFGYLGYKFIKTGTNIFKGNIFDLMQAEPLKKDANGRSNFVIFGTAEDDEGGEHGGANLTDSIMVVSIDQEKKDASMISLPRDLWVQYVETCTVGNQGKLNAAYFCASDDGRDEPAGAHALMAQIKKITGLDIQYYIHVNFTAVVDAVNAVGGVDVTIKSNDPRGILDRNFDWKCGYRCYMVNYKNGQQVHLDGDHALALARARNASGGYGVGDNFGREQNQQMILTALRNKALSAGTLTNLGAVTGLLDALDKNLRTNIENKEVRTIMDVASKIPNDKIISISLNKEGEELLTTGNYSGQSIVRPIAGLLDYSGIHTYIKKQLSSDPFVKEEPHVSVYNGSDKAGVAQTEASKLTDLGFTVDTVGNAPEGSYAPVEVYQVNKSKTATAAKLKALYGVELKTGTPPVSIVGSTDFVVIIGKAPSS